MSILSILGPRTGNVDFRQYLTNRVGFAEECQKDIGWKYSNIGQVEVLLEKVKSELGSLDRLEREPFTKSVLSKIKELEERSPELRKLQGNFKRSLMLQKDVLSSGENYSQHDFRSYVDKEGEFLRAYIPILEREVKSLERV